MKRKTYSLFIIFFLIILQFGDVNAQNANSTYRFQVQGNFGSSLMNRTKVRMYNQNLGNLWVSTPVYISPILNGINVSPFVIYDLSSNNTAWGARSSATSLREVNMMHQKGAVSTSQLGGLYMNLSNYANLTGKYYTFIAGANADSYGLDISIIRTEAPPVSVTSVTNPSAISGLSGKVNQDVGINIELSGSPSCSENVFLIYSTNNWATFSCQPAKGTANKYKAIIPASVNISAATVSYYAVVSVSTKPTMNDIDYLSLSKSDTYSYKLVTKITNETQLRSIDPSIRDAVYEIQNDITLTQVWTPLNRFLGVLDGKGHTIKNFTLSNGTGNIGFFRELGDATTSGVIKNLTIEVSKINIYVSLTTSGPLPAPVINGITTSVGGDFGVLVGRFYKGEISNVHITGATPNSFVGVIGEFVYAGGLVGRMLNATATDGVLGDYREKIGVSITNSSVDIKLLFKCFHSIGGLVGGNGYGGLFRGGGIISSCFKNSLSGFYVTVGVGGIIGNILKNIDVINCYVNGSVYGLNNGAWNNDGDIITRIPGAGIGVATIGGIVGCIQNSDYSSVSNVFFRKNGNGDNNPDGFILPSNTNSVIMSNAYYVSEDAIPAVMDPAPYGYIYGIPIHIEDTPYEISSFNGQYRKPSTITSLNSYEGFSSTVWKYNNLLMPTLLWETGLPVDFRYSSMIKKYLANLSAFPVQSTYNDDIVFSKKILSTSPQNLDTSGILIIPQTGEVVLTRIIPKGSYSIRIRCSKNSASITTTETIQVTEEDVTKIYTEKDLRNIDPSRNDLVYQLQNDITLTISWKPLGRFLGVFDGNGYSIKNFTLRNETGNTGFVRELGDGFYDGEIKNLTIEFANFTTTITPITDNTQPNVLGSQPYLTGDFGLLVGRLYSGMISGVQIKPANTASNIIVNGNGNYYGGGLVGRIFNKNGNQRDGVLIEKSSLEVNSLKMTGFYAAGGLVGGNGYGSLQAGGEIRTSFFRTSSNLSDGFSIENVMNGAGGIMGAIYGNISLHDSYVKGKISGTRNTGGVVGIIGNGNNSEIRNVYFAPMSTISVQGAISGNNQNPGIISNAYLVSSATYDIPSGNSGTSKNPLTITDLSAYTGFGSDVWDYSSSSNPKFKWRAILISTETQLRNITPLNSEYFYKLTNDITLASAWTPINKFYGVFDGNGYSIKNFTLRNETGNTGFVRELGDGFYDGQIKNLTIEFSNFTTTITPITDNTQPNVLGSQPYLTGDFGLLVGRLYSGMISGVQIKPANTASNIIVNGNGNYYGGGLVGRIFNKNGNQRDGVLIEKSSLEVNSLKMTGFYAAGGLVGGNGYGSLQAGGEIRTSFFRTSSNLSDGFSIENVMNGAGGIMGAIYGNISLHDSYVKGKISGTRNTGGVVGIIGNGNNSEIRNVYFAPMSTISVQGAISGNNQNPGIISNAYLVSSATYDIPSGNSGTSKNPLTITDLSAYTGFGSDVWDYSSSSNPKFKWRAILISTETQLRNITPLNSEYFYKLTNDITLASAWTPINKFYGVFDGNGYSIKNFTLRNETGNTGFVRELGDGFYDGEIKNLTIEFANFTTTITPITDNTQPNVLGSQPYLTGDFGLLVGRLYSGMISGVQIKPANTASNIIVNGNGNYYGGGLVGRIFNKNGNQRDGVLIEKSSLEVNSLKMTGFYAAGGLVGGNGYGSLQAGGEIRTSFFRTSSNLSDGFSIENVMNGAGGIMGAIYGNISLHDSYVKGKISGTRNTGGVVGIIDNGNNSEIRNVYFAPMSTISVQGAISGNNQNPGIISNAYLVSSATYDIPSGIYEGNSGTSKNPLSIYNLNAYLGFSADNWTYNQLSNPTLYWEAQPRVNSMLLKFVDNEKPVNAQNVPVFTYPNPVSKSQSMMNFQYLVEKSGTPVKISIYDMLGKEILKYAIDNQIDGKQTYTVNISNYSSGMYIYKVFIGSHIYTDKFMIIN